MRAGLLASAACVLLSPTGAVATPPGQTELPTGGQVTNGNAAVSTSSSTMTVNQSSQKAIIQWNTFNIGSQAAVNFQQPNAASIALNRVMSAAPSQIYGHMSANGQVFLINPSGITFGAGAQVNVGGLVASTLNIADQDFLNGTYTFTGGNSGGAIRNKGTITAGDGGYIGFLAPKIVNKGNLITGRLGSVALAAGDQVTMSFDGNGGVSVQVDPGAVRTLIANHNLIAAPDGRVLMSAQAASVLMGGVINNSGVVEADSLTSNGGVVTLEASNAITNTGTISASGATQSGAGDGGNIKLVSLGTTTVGGSLIARGGTDGGNGGTIETSGNHVVYGGAFIDTRAPNGKTGNWLLDPYDLTVTDGGTSGQDTISNTDLDNELAVSNVTLSTRGSAGDGAGNGDIIVNGAIWWSSPNSLTLNAFRDIDVNANITHAGTGGALAFNPNTGGAGGMLNVTDGFTVTLNSDLAFSISGTQYTLITTAAQLQAIASGLTGHYALANDLDMTGFTFTPVGDSSTTINGYTGSFSGVFEGLGHGIANLTINEPATSDVGLFGFSTGRISDTHLWGESVTGLGNIGGLVGINYGLIANSSAQGTIVGGSGTGAMSIGGLVGCNCFAVPVGASPFMIGTIVNSFALTNVSAGDGVSGVGGFVGSNEGPITGSFTEGSVTVGANASNVGGFAGSNAASRQEPPTVISGSFAQDTVTVGSAGTEIGGFVGSNDGGDITGGSYFLGTVTVGDNASYVGGLAGTNLRQIESEFAGTIDSAFAVGTVTAGSGASNVGGLVGNSAGVITSSYSAVTLSTGDNSTMIGGLVGQNASGSPGIGIPPGTISNSYTLATVTAGSGSSDVGGLVGDNAGTVTASYTTGTTVTSGSSSQSVGGMVGANESSGIIDHTYNYGYNNVVSVGTASSSIGGLAGTNSGTIRNGSYSTGTVMAGSGSGSLGGLVGVNLPNATIDNATAVGTVTGASSAVVGGLVGDNEGTITNSYAAGTVGAADNNEVGGLVGHNGGLVSGDYALGTVIGSDEVGGLVGRNGYIVGSGTVASSYTNTNVSGTARVGGLVGSHYAGLITDSHTFGGQVSAPGGSLVGAIGGLVGYSTAPINNSYNTANVQSGDNSRNVGGLVGLIDLFGAGVTGGYSTGNVAAGSGSAHIGGLVGQSNQVVSGAYATGNVVAGDGSSEVGGLIGSNYGGAHGSLGALYNSYATGSVQAGTGSGYVGGLVGYNSSAEPNFTPAIISGSSASGAVTAGDNSTGVGGLAGYNGGTITSSAASGPVTAGNGAQNVGGLVGQMSGTSNGTIANSNASGNVTVGAAGNAVGSLIGLLQSTSTTITNSFGNGTVTAGAGSTNVGGQVGQTTP